MAHGIPLVERKSPLRGAIDLLAGAYPAFVWGGAVGRVLPVFHFHEVTPERLEPYLQYLVRNGYGTATSDAVSRWIRDGIHPGNRKVVLCFDDAWASVWTVAAPLLKRHGLQGITFAIPGRVRDAERVRPTVADAAGAPPDVDHSSEPFATWPELRALQAGGVIDVQAHTYAHAVVFCDPTILDFIGPGYAPHPHARPCVSGGPPPRFLGVDDLGAPLHPVRSRMSDVLGYDDTSVRERCCQYVRDQGGAVFFMRSDWRIQLQLVAGGPTRRRESPQQREAEIMADLVAARDELNGRLRTNTVRHMCFPWAVAGDVAESCARAADYETAYADVLGGLHAVRARGNPFRMMRLKHKFIYTLPGEGRIKPWDAFRAR